MTGMKLDGAKGWLNIVIFYEQSNFEGPFTFSTVHFHSFGPSTLDLTPLSCSHGTDKNIWAFEWQSVSVFALSKFEKTWPWLLISHQVLFKCLLRLSNLVSCSLTGRGTEVLKSWRGIHTVRILFPIYCVNGPFCIPLHTCKNIFKILKTQNSQKTRWIDTLEDILN